MVRVKTLQGTKLTFLARSHLAPKFSKVVAKAKKLGAIKKKDSWKSALYSNVNWQGFPSFKCLRNQALFSCKKHQGKI